MATTPVRSPAKSRAATAPAGKRRADKSSELLQASDLTGRIVAALRRVPRGRVSTYGEIARVAGLPRRARLVGTVLRQAPAAQKLPWFRILNASGRSSLAAGSDGQRRQWRLLRAEGVEVRNGRVDLQRYGWPSRGVELDALLWKPR